jgi:hypothetical protein
MPGQVTYWEYSIQLIVLHDGSQFLDSRGEERINTCCG